MSPDPMDTPPADFGSDRYDYVEVEAPPGIRPIGQWWDDLIAAPCPDCRANAFARYVGHTDDCGYGSCDNETFETPWHWRITIAHDSCCPWMTAHEAQGRS